MDVSIVIRTKNEEKFISQTLSRLMAQDFNGSYEIIIVDSGSTDSTLEKVAAYDVTVVHMRPDEFSYGRSLNKGIRQARGRFVVNLSAHALPTNASWLQNMISGFTAQDVAGVYGRQISNAQINPFEARQNEKLFGRRPALYRQNSVGADDSAHFSNSNSCIKREVWEKKYFDETVGYAEDFVWQREALAAGYAIAYAPEAAVYHTHPVHISGTYRNSKKCEYAMASANGKAQLRAAILFDMLVSLQLFGSLFFDNFVYITRHRCFGFLKTLPTYVAAGVLGWFLGRLDYRLKL